ncbi:MAG TPA: polysaccharide deacetylase family protein [Symbiobacteriaceae bacterium]|nr:polysaccharide deacetylase family protein [Symbiobacteriaceae bacterium]
MYFVTVTRRQILRRVAYVVGLAVLVVITSLAGGSRQAVAPPNDQPLTRADSPDDRVALTFDVTWGKNELLKIVSTLEAQGVKATFFVGGTFLQWDADLVKQMSARGHEIGTLGQKIIDLSSLPDGEVTSNLLASQSALSKQLGGPVRFFRPPQGPATPGVVLAAREAKLTTVTHSLDAQDYLGQPASRIVQRVVKGARRGDIIRLSASDWAPETSKALPEMIKGLKARGFKLVIISDLMPATVVQ